MQFFLQKGSRVRSRVFQVPVLVCEPNSEDLKHKQVFGSELSSERGRFRRSHGSDLREAEEEADASDEAQNLSGVRLQDGRTADARLRGAEALLQEQEEHVQAQPELRRRTNDSVSSPRGRKH